MTLLCLLSALNVIALVLNLPQVSRAAVGGMSYQDLLRDPDFMRAVKSIAQAHRRSPPRHIQDDRRSLVRDLGEDQNSTRDGDAASDFPMDGSRAYLLDDAAWRISVGSRPRLRLVPTCAYISWRRR